MSLEEKINDELWDFSDIILAIDARDKLTPDELHDWYWETVESHDNGGQIINLKSYTMGARYV